MSICSKKGFGEMWGTKEGKTVKFAAVLLLLVLLNCLPVKAAMTQKPDESVPVQVGLYYGGSAAPTFNLQNVDGYGTGYRFGYFDNSLKFTQLGYTTETKISILKTSNIYLTDTQRYTTEPTSHGMVGCYHVQLPGSYTDFESAKAEALRYGGFPAWIGGNYYVRVGSYLSADAALKAAASYGGSVGENSAYGVSVTITGTSMILFQFDDLGKGSGLGVYPGLMEDVQTQTWCSGYRYFGAFRYQRMDGGNLTLVNLLNINDYINCVISQEMSESWPLEALKAQAVCARNYYAVSRGKHGTHGFDICASVHCQAYIGASRVGSNTTLASKETMGTYLWHGGELVETFYFSSDGGATESSENVWTQARPYLKGVTDPYEAIVSKEIKNYHWSYNFTGTQLQEKLVDSGRTNCAEIISVDLNSTAMGNVSSITFHDANGKGWTLYKEACRTVLGLPSMRFTLGEGNKLPDGEGSSIWINGVEKISTTEGLFAINGKGNQVVLSNAPYIITGGGTEVLKKGNMMPTGSRIGNASGGSFIFNGSGNGHNVGMSQWGAYAMAKQGFDYQSILTFYYTGVTLK